MADPILLTGIVGAVAGVVGAGTPIWLKRLQDRREREAEDKQVATELAGSAKALAGTSVESWEKLVEALNRELKRLQDDIERIRHDAAAALEQQRREYEASMQRQREDYEGQLTVARQRITELENAVESLKLIINPQQGHQ